jgi:hypothetical protein
MLADLWGVIRPVAGPAPRCQSDHSGLALFAPQNWELVEIYIHTSYLNEVPKIAGYGLAADDIVLNGIAFGYERARVR